MRNLKRALSLTLASVMLLGMMVVGSSAAAGYDDVSETDNVEAIEVLQAIEVMVGDERGFGPERPVNRAEMAVVMGKLLSLDYNYYTATCPFDDVYDWARGWVGACAANGIVSGRGEGVYDPGATVTAVEAASMLMRALGYFKYQNDYADGFEVSTVRQGTKIGIFNGVGSSATEPMTRNQVAQMVLNALQSAVVEPDGNTINLTTPDGTVYTGKVNYVSVTSAKSFATAISRTQATSVGSQNDGWIVELGERLYDGKLKLTDTTDDFGRPSRYWEYDAKEIGTYVKEELIREEYTVKVTGRTLHDLLGSTILKDYDLDVYIDGIDDPAINTAVFGANSLVRTNENAVGKTGNGVLTQVFVDPDEGSKGLITIAIINTYLAIADEDFDDRTDDLDITVYGIREIAGYKNEYEKDAKNDDGTSDKQKEGFKLETEDFPSIVDAKDGDAYLVTVAQGEVQTIAKPEIMSGAQISSFKRGDWIVTDGTQYSFANAAEFECKTLYDYTTTENAVINLKDITYNVYLDKYGYAIGVEEVERVENYLFITGVDTNTLNRYAVQADASAIFVDGTMEAIKVDMKAARDLKDQATYQALMGNGTQTSEDNWAGGSLINKWFSYTVGDDGVYELVLVGDDVDVDKGARAGQFRTLNKKDEDIYALDSNLKPTSDIVALGKTQGVDEIGPKSIALRGADKAQSTWYSVYGDDQSVYITAELETIQDAHDNKAYMVNIISGVDNVTVGIDNASIDVWDRATALTKGDGKGVSATAYGSYVLFDDDGDIIAAVVVGEDSGAVTNLVYTHKSSIESETDNNASGSATRANGVKGTYTWTRKVVSNGEEVLLTEVGSGLSKLKSMEPYTWYVVKYNAKGEVKNVYAAWDTSTYYDNFKGLIDAPVKDADGKVNWTAVGENSENEKVRTEDQYVNNIEELNTATNENNMVLFEVGQYNNGIYSDAKHTKVVRTAYEGAAVGNVTHLGGPVNPSDVRMSGKPYVDNHTMYITTQTNAGLHRGFRVADDVKTVFIQMNNREWTTTFESGYNRLEKVVDRLHETDEIGNWANERNYYHYEISAVMENGKATVVVIRDLNNAGATWDKVAYNRELKLYGNLFTSPTTVTGASNTVVTVGDKEIVPTGIGTDSYGSYTIYSIPEKSVVSIVDYDIDNVDGFDCIYNSDQIKDLVVRPLSRRITFTMPEVNSWIDGGRAKTFVQTIQGKLATGEDSLTGKNVTFEGVGPNTNIADQKQGMFITIVIRDAARAITLVDGQTYAVTLGTPAQIYYAEAKDGALTFEYKLTGGDIREGVVLLRKIEAYNGSTTPTEPDDPTKPTVAVTGVSLDKKTASVAVDGQVTLTATVEPTNATNKAVTWSTNDSSVATVTNGVVTGVKAGTATITVTTVDGGKTATCAVTVTGGSIVKDDKVTASVTTNASTQVKSAAFRKYAPDVAASVTTLEDLTPAEIAAALTASTGVKFDETGVVLTSGAGKATSADGTVEITIPDATPTRTYQVKYPGGVKYITAAESPVSVSDVTTGVTALIDTTKVAAPAANGATVSSQHVASLALGVDASSNKIDIEYVAAVELDQTANVGGVVKKVTSGAVTDWASSTSHNILLAEVKLGTGNQLTALDSTNHRYIKVNTPIYFTGHSDLTGIKAGQTITLTVNGSETKTLTADANGEFAQQSITVTAGNASVSNQLTLKAVVSDVEVPVYLNKANKDDTTATPVTKAADGSVEITVPKGQTLVYLASGGYTAVSGTPDSQGTLTLSKSALSTIAAADQTKAGEINLFTAYSVVSSDTTSTGKWTAYKALDADKSDVSGTGSDKIDKSTATYYPVVANADARTIYIKGEAGVILSKKGETTILANPLKPIVPAPANQFIWKYVVEGNVNATTFEPLITLSAYGADIGQSLTANTPSATKIAIDGVTLRTGVVMDVTGSFTANTAAGKPFANAKSVTVNVTENTGKTGFEFTITSDVAVTRPASDAADIADVGTLEIVVGGISITIPVELTKAS